MERRPRMTSARFIACLDVLVAVGFIVILIAI